MYMTQNISFKLQIKNFTSSSLSRKILAQQFSDEHIKSEDIPSIQMLILMVVLSNLVIS